MQKAKQVIAQWPAFARKYDLDPDLGVLIHPDYQVTSFHMETLQHLVESMKSLDSIEKLKDFFDSFPDMGLKEERSSIDMIILHDFLVFVVEKFTYYCRELKRPINESVLPKNIAVPLYESSRQLEINQGMGYGQVYNWVPKKLPFNPDTEDFDYQDFDLKTTLTQNVFMEKMFFGGSIIASYHLAKAFRSLYEINAIIDHAPQEQDEVVKRLMSVKSRWQKIINHVQVIIKEFDYEYFKGELTNLVDGFKGLIFEGVENGNNKPIDGSRGSGGADPSYQIFDRVFGLKYEGPIVDGHARLKKSMPNSNNALMDFWTEHSHIRQYCDCTLKLTKAYNDVLITYSEFLFLHQCFIRKFFLSQKDIPKTSDQKVDLQQGSDPQAVERMKGFLSHFLQTKAQVLSTEGKQ